MYHVNRADEVASLPTRGAWIEISEYNTAYISNHWSLPTRGAWIEIILLNHCGVFPYVAPYAGSVD